MPVRIIREPLGALIYGGEGGLCLAVMATPCELVERRDRRWTKDKLLRLIAAGNPCPPDRESLARECRRLGYLYRPRRRAWAITPEGASYLNED